jgi:uncharacterized protein (TIGR02996 family)
MSDSFLTDEYVYRISPDGKSARSALELVRDNEFREPRWSAGGTRLEAECRDYSVRVDLDDPERPRTGCTCASYKRPCKHALGLLFLAVRSPERFANNPGHLSINPDPPRMLDTIARPAEEKPRTPADVGEALLQDVLAHPTDDAPRLIYADWLEEAGQHDRAEFIRVQMDLARAAAHDPRLKSLRAREKELWTAHRAEWLQTVPPPLQKRRITFQRGFLDELHLLPKDWATYGAALFACHPLHRIRLTGRIDHHGAGALVVLPQLSRVNSLSLAGCQFRERLNTLQILFTTPFWSGLTRLVLARGGFDSRSLGVLVASPLLAQLVALDLADNEIGPAGAQALAGSPAAANLRELSLANNPITNPGALALAQSAHLASLERLDLSGVGVRPDTRDALRRRFGERVVLSGPVS